MYFIFYLTPFRLIYLELFIKIVIANAVKNYQRKNI